MKSTPLVATEKRSSPARPALFWALADALVVAKRQIRQIPRIPDELITATLQPVIIVLMFRYLFGGAIVIPGTSYVNYLMAGAFVQSAVLGSASTGVGVANDLQRGLIDRFRTLPMAQSAVLAGRVLANLIRGLCIILVIWIIGLLVGSRPEGTVLAWMAASGLVLLTSFVFSWFAAMVGLLLHSPEAVAQAGLIWILPFVFGSSAFVLVTRLRRTSAGVVDDGRGARAAAQSIRCRDSLASACLVHRPAPRPHSAGCLGLWTSHGAVRRKMGLFCKEEGYFPWEGGPIRSVSDTAVNIQSCSRSVPSVPDWFGEVTLIFHYLRRQGILVALAEQVCFARRRFGRYEVVDFLAVLFGYAISGEQTLEAFYERLRPWASAFMALFGRERLPARSTLSRFLAALTPEPVEALRTCFLSDLLARPLGKEQQLGGLWDRQESRWLVFDVDGTREATRQRAMLQTPDQPAAQRRLRPLCAPGYLGRKRGAVVRTRTTALLAHPSQWLGTFGNPGDGEYRVELRRAVAAVGSYMQNSPPPVRTRCPAPGWAIWDRSSPGRPGRG